ncbi:MAG: carboxypeptidase regulatory-like domain-containing protein [Terriglobia bacterium]
MFGQGFSGAISGVVRDNSQAVVPDTAVTVRQIETGLTRTAETDVAGRYSLPSLPVGEYEVIAMKPGFRVQVRRGINLSVGQEAVLNLTLEVGSVQQTVEVTGEAPLVNTTVSSTSGLITQEQLKDMPLNGRSFEQLLTLNTGTVDNESHSGGSSFSVAGKRTETNRFTMNGVDMVGTNATGQYIAPQGSSGYLLGVDAVREYNVLGHTYGAEYGKRAGGQISVVTTSGTNQLHGAAFEYLRNSSLDARNFFDDEVAPFRRNQFGGSLGGPIIRDKMFVFGNYEGFRERLGESSNVVVPNLQARQGRLPCYLVYATDADRRANCGGTDRNSLNAYIPVPNLAPGMLPFFRHWLEPNGEEELTPEGLATGTARYRANPGRPINEDFGLARYDYNVSSADSLSTNFTVSRGFLRSVAANPLFRANQPRDIYTLSVQETHIFSPTVLNVALFGWSRTKGENFGNIPEGEPFPDNLLLMKGKDGGNPGAFTWGGAAATNVASSIVPANGNNFHFNKRQYFTGSNDLRMTRGRHNLSLGVWVMRVQQTAFSSAQQSAGTAAYEGLLAFLQDRPTQFQGLVNPQVLNFRSTEAAWYFQDEIRLRPNLTVRLGLRDEMTTGWNETNGRASNYLFDPNGVIQTVPHIGRSPFVENHAIALWQPRVGVAWDPTGAGSWAVRAAFGIHNDLQDNLAHRLIPNAPFGARLQITGTPLLSIIPVDIASAAPPFCTGIVGGANVPAGCAIFSPGGLDPTMHTPTIQQWSLEIERAITSDLAVQAGYVGHQSYHFSTSLDTNTILPVRCENPTDPRGCPSGGILREGPAGNRRPLGFVPAGTEYNPWGTNDRNTRPNPLVGSTQSWFYSGTASYHALNLSLLKRSRGGLSFKTNYTWAKMLDINSAILPGSADNEPAQLYNRANPQLNRGIASYSLLHQFNTNVSYQLPFGRGRAFGGAAAGWVEKLIGGWQWNTIFNAQSGFPMNPLVGANRSGNGDARNPDRPNRNPNFTGPVVLGVDGFKKTGRYFDPNAFLLPPAGTFGNVARGAFRGPGLVNLDTSLFKRIPLNERWNLQFRAEAFNVLNHANLDIPLAAIFEGANYSGTAGVITETSNRERQIQFALRLEF